MARAGKPYQRSSSDTYKRGNPDGPGQWKHDMHNEPKSLLQRLSGPGSSSSSSKPSLLQRMSGGQGKELMPSSSSSSKLYGFGGQAPQNPNNMNSGVELLPSSGGGAGPVRQKRGVSDKGRLVQSGIDAALGRSSQPRREVRPIQVQEQRESVSIMGMSRGTTWLRIENLAQGTTAEDVMSAFAPAPIENARVTSSSSSSTVTVELEMSNLQAAEEIKSRYHGVHADGNTLAVTIIKHSLVDRMGRPGNGVQRSGSTGSFGNGRASAGGQELLPRESGGKMYSDTVLMSNPRAAITTLAQDEEATRRNRAQAWRTNGPSLADRMGMGSTRGRGQTGGMMVD